MRLVDFLAVTNDVNTYLSTTHIIDDTVVSDTQFSIALETAAKRRSKTNRIRHKSFLNGFSNAYLNVSVDLRQIDG